MSIISTDPHVLEMPTVGHPTCFSQTLWFLEIAQQAYETMSPDLWFGEQGHCVHCSKKKLPSKPWKLATEVQETEPPSNSFTLGPSS